MSRRENYLLNDPLLLKKLFSFDYDLQSVDTYHFVSFHKQMMEKILSKAGINIAKFDENALSEAGKASFYDVGYFLKDATYLGNGIFVAEKMIEYKTDVFEIMAFISVNILRNMPILSVSFRDGQEYDEASKYYLRNPNEFSILSLYDELSKLFCLEYGINREDIPFTEKLEKIIFDRQKFVVGHDAYNSFKSLLFVSA